MKEVEDKNALVSFLLPPCLYPLHLDLFKLRPPRVGEEDIMDFTLLFNLLYNLFSLLTLSLPPRQMVSPNRNREDGANKGDLNISTQTQELRAMVPIMVKLNRMLQSKPHFLGTTTLLAVRNIRSQQLGCRLIKRSY